MTQFSFQKISLILVLNVLFLEIIGANSYLKLIKINKNYKISKLKQHDTYTWKSFDYLLIIWLIIFYMCTLKIKINIKINLNFYYFYIFNTLIILFFYSYVSKNKNNNFFFFLIFFFLIFFFFFLVYTQSLITFLFVIEIFSIIYYFFFLEKIHNYSTLNLLQYKNFLITYLWNSFLSTMIYVISNIILLFEVGTISFNELEYFKTTSTGLTLLLISFFWKTNTALFHFFKIEIYKYISKELIMLFSTTTLVFNFILFYFLLLQNFFFFFLQNSKSLNFFITFFAFIVVYKQKIHTFQEFLAYSSVITSNIIISLFIV